ncbi:hypothetical protein V8C37DRAFT_399165 [Trichoderma ceciliae]
MLFTLFQALTLLVISAMALSPRDAIHTNDIDRYDSFIKDLELMDDYFLDMYLNNGTVIIDVYQHPSNDLTRTELFAPSSNAQQYFDQEKAAADEILGSHSQADKSLAERGPCGGPGPDPDERSEDSVGLEKRRSNCFQFCGTIANCRGNNTLNENDTDEVESVVLEGQRNIPIGVDSENDTKEAYTDALEGVDSKTTPRHIPTFLKG